jgi:hypothetical protein
MYIKRKAIEKTGLFDEKYFMYGEDVDWCNRARQSGCKIVYTPKTSITHFDEGKSKERYPNKFYNMRKGFLSFFKKYKKEKDLKLFLKLLRLELQFKNCFGPKDKKWQNIYKILERLINENSDSVTKPCK